MIYQSNMRIQRSHKSSLFRPALGARGVLGAIAAIALNASCGPLSPTWTQSLAVLDPVAVENGLVYVEPDRSRVAVLDLSTRTPQVRHAPVGPRAISAIRRPGTQEVLVLAQGERGAPGVEPVPGSLSVVDVAPNATGAITTPKQYSVRSPFNAMAVTPDGKYAVIHFTPSQSLERLLFNPNEIAVVDLTRPPVARVDAANPVLNPIGRTVRSFGGIPNRVLFSPPISIMGEMRTLAVVVSESYITLIDLQHLDRQETTVRLTLPEDARAIIPEQVLFDFAGEQKNIYLRASQSNDVYVVHIADEAPVMGSNDFRVTINQLAAGRVPSDLALFGEGASRRLLVVSSGSREVRVVDTTSNAITTLALDAPVQRALLFNGPSPRDPVASQRALLYSDQEADNARAVSFVDLTAIEQRGAQNIETVQLGRPVRFALPLPEQNTILFEHSVVTAQGRLSLLNLYQRATSPILAEVSLQGAQFSSDRRLLWVAPRGIDRVGYVDLADFHPGEIRMDATVSGVIPLPVGMDMRERVVAIHPDASGYVTLIDAMALDRRTAVSARGFLLTDALAGGQ